ncbi:hypothetical protein AOG1_00030 [Geobacter sp. AOG1]|nr:hypothetical protein AOG1_00030 [Geobacter sp. AOG1]
MFSIINRSTMHKEKNVMVVLVRCSNETCVPALESRLSDLIRDGLITAFLRDGLWINLGKTAPHHEAPPPKSTRRLIATVAPL